MSNNVARGTLLGMAGQAWHLLTAFLLYAFLARALGPSLFGTWRVVISVLTWLEIFMSAGLIRLTTKAISEAPGQRPRYARAAYLGQVSVAIGVFLVWMVVAGPVAAALSNPDMAMLLRIAALDIPLYGIFMVASSVVLGTRLYERQAVAWIAYATAKAGFIAILVAVGFSVPGALIGNALSSIVGFAFAFIPSRDHQKTADMIRLARVTLLASTPYLVFSLIDGVGRSVDLWMLSGYGTAIASVGLYSAAQAFAEIPTFLFQGLNRVVFPATANANSQGDRGLASTYATQAIRVGVIVTVLAIALIAATGREALSLVYGAKFLGAFVPLVILMVAAMGRTLRDTCSEILLAGNRRKTAIGLLFSTVALEIVMLVVLIARFGSVGAAAAASITSLLAAGGGLMLLRESLGTRPLATFMRCVLAGAVTFAALVLIRPEAFALLVAYPIAAAVYGALLWVLREFDADDIGSVRAALGR